MLDDARRQQEALKIPFSLFQPLHQDRGPEQRGVQVPAGRPVRQAEQRQLRGAVRRMHAQLARHSAGPRQRIHPLERRLHP
ncbi:hypothetical protein CDAR_562771 [Caerostris darwini]|uniref:Wingless n=1 Tax=Caerostris darwini TaxID=1538125 RepID=A0AAV4X7M3_9ARAC|nr:hypothetical protein CDAR_562771 [Caerostris darwini]